MYITPTEGLSPYYLDGIEDASEGTWAGSDHIYYGAVGPQEALGVRELPKASNGPELGVSVGSVVRWAYVTDGNKIAKTNVTLPGFPFSAYLLGGEKVEIEKTGETAQFHLIQSIADSTVTLAIYGYEPDWEAPETSNISTGFRLKPLLGAPYGPILSAHITPNSWVYPYPYPKTTVSSFRHPEVQYGTVAGAIDHDVYSDTHFLMGYSEGRYRFRSASVMPEHPRKVLEDQLVKDQRAIIGGKNYALNVLRLNNVSS